MATVKVEDGDYIKFRGKEYLVDEQDGFVELAGTYDTVEGMLAALRQEVKR